MCFEEVSSGVGLPRQAKEVYEELYRSAWEHYEKNETRRDSSSQAEVAHRFAWAAVEQLYKQDASTGYWLKCQLKDGTEYENAQ